MVNKDQYFMNIAKAVSIKSSCTRRQVGAIIVKDGIVVCTGYNGTPKGLKNCNEGGCPRGNEKTCSGKNLEDSLCCHAEENAIVQAAYSGINVKDSTIYATLKPCHLCSKMIINAGIKEVVYQNEYNNELGSQLLEDSNIIVRKIDE